MTLRFYLKYCIWGFLGCGYLVYMILTKLHDGSVYPPYIPYMPYIAAYLTISAVLFPFAFYASEALALKLMSKDNWDAHFGDNSPSWGAFIFVYIICVLLSVPLFIIFLFVKKNRPVN